MKKGGGKGEDKGTEGKKEEGGKGLVGEEKYKTAAFDAHTLKNVTINFTFIGDHAGSLRFHPVKAIHDH